MIMEKRLSQKELENFYRREVRAHGRTGVEEIVNKTRNTPEDHKKQKSIFLCHSHKDKTIVDKIALLFNKLEFNIYVDWMDNAMPKVTNKETAAQIKEKIAHSHRFLFLATASALASKWCDWELGVAYSMKKTDDLAILPIESWSGNWKGSEYMHLYSVMEIQEKELENVDTHEVFVKRDEGKRISLSQWLTN
jgi:hypothetical protein